MVVVAARTTRARVAGLAVAVALAAVLAGSTAYAIATISQPHSGGGPSVGPAMAARSDSRRGGWGFGQDADNPQLEAMLSATRTDWSAAITRSSAAADLELNTHTAVMAIGGFSGNDPVPTLSRFQQYVADRQLTYYIATTDRHNGGPQSNRAHSDIANWVAANYSPIKVGDDTVYDLTKPVKR